MRFASIFDPILRRRRADGPMKINPASPQRRTNGGVLRQKAISGMDGVGAGLSRRRDDRVHVEITRARRRRPDTDGLVRRRDMRRLRIGVGIDRDGADAQAGAGPHDRGRRSRRGWRSARNVSDVEKPQIAQTGALHPIDRSWSRRGGCIAPIAMQRPSTSRVSRGSIRPSSQSRAVQ